MMCKRILLIEDDYTHLEATQLFLTTHFIGKLTIAGKSFTYPNPVRQEQKNVIVQYIRENSDFDILMIDMLLGGDSEKNPLGLEVVNELRDELEHVSKKIVAYTKISGKNLFILKDNLKGIDIICKPSISEGVFDRLHKEFQCDKRIRLTTTNCPEDNVCTNEKYLVCQIEKYIFG